MINVVAAVICNKDNKILIAQRNFKKSQGGLWEFPGGKIEPGETREQAIVREIKEEMNIEIEVEKYLAEKVFKYPEKTINLIALKCIIKNGTISLNEHEDAKWISISEISKYNFAPADIFILDMIK